MAINLPERRFSVAPRPERRKVPIEQILAVMGNNPVAQALPGIGKQLGEALMASAARKRQEAQISGISKATGIDLAGITDPAIASSIAKSTADNRSEEARAREALEARKAAAAESAEMRRMMAESLMESREANRRQKEEQFQDKQVNSYSANLEKSGIPNAVSVGERVLNLLPERGQDVPGYGATGMNPEFMLTRPGKDMRQAASQLFNIELRNRSGAAVTDPELNRLKQEFGQGNFATDESLITGINQYITRLKEVARNIDAGVDGGVRSEYVNRGGRDMGAAFDSMATNSRILPLPKGKSRAESLGEKYGF